MFCARLNAEGIHASIAHENHVWNNWPLSNALGGVKVQVPLGELDAARVIEQACRRGEYYNVIAEASDDEPDGFKCPNCGSQEIRSWHTWPEFFFSLISVFFGSAILPARPSGYRCKQCGVWWKV